MRKRKPTNASTSSTTYKLISGSHAIMVHAKIHLIVEHSMAEKIHALLQKSTEKNYFWELLKDDILEDMAATFLVTAVARKVVLEGGEDIPSDLKVEDDILHFITSGKSRCFKMRYATLEVMNAKDGIEESTLASFVISKQEHMIIFERIKEVSELAKQDGDAYYVGHIDLLSRKEYHSTFGKGWYGYMHVYDENRITDKWVQSFMTKTASVLNGDCLDLHNFLRDV